MEIHPELIDYISKARAAGMSNEEMRSELLKIGWMAEEVDSAVVPPPTPRPERMPMPEPVTVPEKVVPAVVREPSQITAQEPQKPRKSHVFFYIVCILLIATGGAVYYFLPQILIFIDKFVNPSPAVEVADVGQDSAVIKNETQDSPVVLGDESDHLGFKSCVNSLFSSYDRTAYDYWKSKFASLHPDLSVYDAGAYCDLQDGTKLISFSHFKSDVKGQTVALFDSADSLLKETKDFYCPTAGDLGTPHFISIQNGIVRMTCSSSDGAYSFVQDYDLDLNDFTFKLVSDTEYGP